MSEIKKYEYIDALRGWAVLMVLVVHTGVYLSVGSTFPEWFKMLWIHGEKGVQLFFILSALTLFMSYNKRKQDEKRPILNFFIRRFFRVAPMFYVAMIVYNFGIDWFGIVENKPSVLLDSSAFISSITFTFGWNPYWINSIVPGGWSVGVEMMFYMSIPLLFKFITNFRRAVWLSIIGLYFSGILVLYLSKLHFVSDVSLWTNYLYYFFINQFPVFLLGVMLYYVIYQKVNASICPIDLILIALILFFQIVIQKGIWQISRIVHDTYIISFLFTILIYSLSVKPMKFFVNVFFILTGRVSYSMYLMHFLVVFLMVKFEIHSFVGSSFVNFGICFCFLIIISLLISICTHYIVEKNGVKIGNKLIYLIERREK